MSVIRDIDFCGSVVGIMYNGNRRYKSLIGGSLTIISGLGILAVAIYYLQIFFTQKTAKMSMEDTKYWEPPEQDLSKDFTFAIMMQYQGENKFLSNIVKVDAYHIQKHMLEITRTPVSTIPCVRKDYQNDSLYNSLQLDKALCFNLSNIILKGSNVNDIFEYFQIRFLLCIDGTDDCYPKSKMAEFFQDNKPLALIYFLDSTFQINNKKDRYKTFVNYVDVNVTFSNAKATNIYFSKNEMKVDENYFFSTSPDLYSRYMIDSFRDLVSVRTDLQDEALLLNLMSSKNKQTINITYMQLSELLANIGALINVIILFLSSIGNYINHYYFQSDLMNALYTFESSKKRNGNYFSFKQTSNLISLKDCSNVSCSNHEINISKKEENDKNSQVIKSNNEIELHLSCPEMNNGNNEMNDNQPSLIGKNSSNQVNQVGHNKLQLKNKHRFSIQSRSNTNMNDKAFDHWDIAGIAAAIVFPFIKCSGIMEKKKRFHLIENSMSSFQDFINLFKKLQEIDIVKYLLLTSEQLNMYGIIPKPEWKTKVNQRFSTLYHQKDFHFLKSYKEIDIRLHHKDTRTNLVNYMTKPRRTEVDDKLIELIKTRLGTLDKGNDMQ